MEDKVELQYKHAYDHSILNQQLVDITPISTELAKYRRYTMHPR